MMRSETKESALRRHNANALLNIAAPPLIPESTCDLRVDQPRANISEDAISSAHQALRSGQTHYVDVPGIGPLREAIAAYLADTGASSYRASNVLVTAGVQESRFLSLQKIGEQFDHILVPSVVHPGVRRALGTRKQSIIELAVDERSGLPRLDTIREALGAGSSRLLYLESPSRLTGRVYSGEDIAALAAMLEEFDAGLIVDQGLAPWVAEGKFHSPAVAKNGLERVAVLGEAWPGTGLENWFIGYIATPEKWFEAMRAQKQMMAICTSTPAQYAALQVAQSYATLRAAHLKKLVANHARAVQLVRDAGLDPLPGDAVSVLAVYVGNQEMKIGERLRQKGYLVASGADFGAPGIVRMAVGLDESSLSGLQDF